jgi:hypothetical protein
VIRSLVIFIFLSASLSSTAQYRLMLLKKDKTIISFREGDYIRFKRSDKDHFTRGFIGGIYEGSFRIGEDTTFLHQLEKIDLTNLPNSGFRTSAMGRGFILTGLVLFLGDWLNTTVVQDEKYTAHSGVIVTSSVLVAAGTTMQVVNNDYFVLGRKKKAVIIDW